MKIFKRRRLERLQKSLIKSGAVIPSEDVKITVGDPFKPAHYHSGGIDVFTYAEANDEEAGLIGYHRWSAVKYTSRAGKKEGNTMLQDFKKAQVHINELVRIAAGEQDGQ